MPVSTEIEQQTQALGSFANPQGQPVVGQQVPGAPGFDVKGLSAADGLAMLAQLGPAIQQAMKTGNVQISQGEPQVLDMRGSGLREEIMGIMSQHGIDPVAGTAGETVDAGKYGDMQKQIFEALAKHGVPTPTEGVTFNAGATVNAGDYGDMQKELMDVLANHGLGQAGELPPPMP